MKTSVIEEVEKCKLGGEITRRKGEKKRELWTSYPLSKRQVVAGLFKEMKRRRDKNGKEGVANGPDQINLLAKLARSSKFHGRSATRSSKPEVF